MRRFLHRLPAVGGMLLFALLCAALAAGPQYLTIQVATITVTNTNDNGPGSLRQALADAQDGNTIQFDPALNGQTISLTSGELVINKNISINGPSPELLTVSRLQNTPQFFGIIRIMSSHIVAIQGLTISGGVGQKFGAGFGGISNDQSTLTIDNCTVASNRSFYGGGGIFNFGTLTVSHSTISGNDGGFEGGGISNRGTLTIMNSTIRNNTSGFPPGVIEGSGYGGGIRNSGMVTISNSTINDNTAGGELNQTGKGGGIANSGVLVISNSTISHNWAAADGGAIYGGGSITNCTISSNTASQGGGISTPVELGNTILKAGSGPNISNTGGTVTSHGHNLSSDDGGGFLTGPADQINTDPLLGPLQENGGPTFTHELLIGSPAINAGDPNFTPPPDFDQRGPGFPRVFNSRIDIGSIELQTIAPTPTPTPGPVQALNLSTRMKVETGDNVGIGGFIITGTDPKQVLLRAIGPSLISQGVPDPLADPVLELHGPPGFETIINDNCGAPGPLPTPSYCKGLNDLESAILVTLDPGAYTAILKGNNGGTGVGLVEVYDLGSGANSKLANISTRCLVQTGNDIMIAGFILGGNTQSDNFVMRAIGPSLTGQGVADALADPTLELRDGNGNLIIANNDWQDDPVQAIIISAAGLAPQNFRESAIAATLAPGPYTALLAGRDNGIGVGLVEVYDIDGGLTPPTPTPNPVSPTPSGTPARILADTSTR
jgi:hypothetical protein